MHNLIKTFYEKKQQFKKYIRFVSKSLYKINLQIQFKLIFSRRKSFVVNSRVDLSSDID